MTANCYSTTADTVAIQAILDAHFTTGDDIEMDIKGNQALIIIYS